MHAALVSVVVPRLNERATIGKRVERALGASFEKDLIIVDDGSTDGGQDYLKVTLYDRMVPWLRLKDRVCKPFGMNLDLTAVGI